MAFLGLVYDHEVLSWLLFDEYQFWHKIIESWYWSYECFWECSLFLGKKS